MKQGQTFQGTTGQWYTYTGPDDGEPSKETSQRLDNAPQPDFNQIRSDVAKGITLRPFGIDTGVEMPRQVTEALAGSGKRMNEIGRAVGLLDEEPAQNAGADQLLNKSGYATAGAGVTDLLGMTAAGGGVGLLGDAVSGVPVLGKALQVAGRSLINPSNVGEAALGNGAYAAATSEGDRLRAAELGAAGGAGGYSIAKLLGKLISPNITAQARTLLDNGVDDLTPGQMFGGAVKATEDKLTSVPVLGDMIRNSQKRSIDSFNGAAINDALSIVGSKLPDGMKAGRAAIAEADRLIGNKMNAVVPKITVKVDRPLTYTLNKIQGMATGLPETQQKWLSSVFDDQFSKSFGNPTKTALGDTYQTFMRSLKDEATHAIEKGGPWDRKAGQALMEMRKAFQNAMLRQNGSVGREYMKTQAAYAAMSRVRDASISLGAKEGTFTPAMLLRQIRDAAPGNSFAHGTAFGQKIGDAANVALPSSIPDSGTTGRALMTVPGLATAVPTLPGSLLYTKAGQTMARKALSNRPAYAPEVRALLDRLAGLSGRVGDSYALQQGR